MFARILPFTTLGQLRLAILLLLLLVVAYFSQAQVIAYRLGYTPEQLTG